MFRVYFSINAHLRNERCVKKRHKLIKKMSLWNASNISKDDGNKWMRNTVLSNSSNVRIFILFLLELNNIRTLGTFRIDHSPEDTTLGSVRNYYRKRIIFFL